jgi:hypothetical protein
MERLQRVRSDIQQGGNVDMHEWLNNILFPTLQVYNQQQQQQQQH